MAHVVTVDWGDGNVQKVNLLAAATSFKVSHKYLNDQHDAAIPVAVTITSPSGFSFSGTATRQVFNLPPSSVVISGTTTGNAPEGKPITLGPSITDPGVFDTFTESWTVKKNGVFFDSGTNAGFTFTPDDQGAYTVTMTATDDSGARGRGPGDDQRG